MTPEEEFEASNPEAEFDAAPAESPAVLPGQTPEPAALSPTSQSGTALRGFAQGASLGFLDELAGLADVASELEGRGLPSLPSPLLGAANLPRTISALLGPGRQALSERREGEGLVDALMRRYRQGRDAARGELATGAQANPKTAIGSQLAGALLLPVPGAGGARVGSSLPGLVKGGTAMGAAAGLGGSRADLTRGEGGQALFDAGTSAAMGGAGGALAGGLGVLASRLARRGGSVIGDAVAMRAAQDADEVAAEVARLKGQLGAETQKGSRLLENLQRGVSGTPPASTPAGLAPQTQSAAIQALNSPEAAALQTGVLQQSMADLPGQLSAVAARRAAFQQAAQAAPQTAARRTQDYFAAPLIASEVVPRLSRLGQRALTATGTGLVSGTLGALGGSAAGGDPISSGLGAAAAGFGAVMGGPGMLQMARNVAASPRVGAAAAESAVRALGNVPQVVGRASQAVNQQTSTFQRRDQQEAVDAFLTAP